MGERRRGRRRGAAARVAHPPTLPPPPPSKPHGKNTNQPGDLTDRMKMMNEADEKRKRTAAKEARIAFLEEQLPAMVAGGAGLDALRRKAADINRRLGDKFEIPDSELQARGAPPRRWRCGREGRWVLGVSGAARFFASLAFSRARMPPPLCWAPPPNPNLNPPPSSPVPARTHTHTGDVRRLHSAAEGGGGPLLRLRPRRGHGGRRGRVRAAAPARAACPPAA